MKRPKNIPFYGTASLLNILVLLLLAGIATNWWQNDKADAVMASAFSTVHIQQIKAERSGRPRQLSIPELNLNLAIKDGQFNADGSWTLDNTNAFYAVGSMPLNVTQGTTLIYGHNIEAVFKSLHNLYPGAELKLTTENNLKFTYEYSFVSQVNPNDVSVFNATNAPNVTLQTCSGPWDQYRSMYTFRYKSVERL